MEADLGKRIVLLELEVRRWKVVSFVVLIAMTVLVVAAAAPPEQTRRLLEDGFVQQVPASRLAARDFTLVGNDGKPYARLFTKENEPFLEFYDAKGEVIWSAPPGHRGFRPVPVNGR